MYAAPIGTFAQRDPLVNRDVILGISDDAVTANLRSQLRGDVFSNLYEYVNNNPKNHIDPSGLQVQPLPPTAPPPFPNPGVASAKKPNIKTLLGFNLCCFEPSKKKDRLKPIPKISPPAVLPVPFGPVGGDNQKYGLPYPTPVGAGGCGPCIGVIIQVRRRRPSYPLHGRR